MAPPSGPRNAAVPGPETPCTAPSRLSRSASASRGTALPSMVAPAGPGGPRFIWGQAPRGAGGARGNRLGPVSPRARAVYSQQPPPPPHPGVPRAGTRRHAPAPMGTVAGTARPSRCHQRCPSPPGSSPYSPHVPPRVPCPPPAPASPLVPALSACVPPPRGPRGGKEHAWGVGGGQKGTHGSGCHRVLWGHCDVPWAPSRGGTSDGTAPRARTRVCKRAHASPPAHTRVRPLPHGAGARPAPAVSAAGARCEKAAAEAGHGRVAKGSPVPVPAPRGADTQP